jgi:NADH-quinone oxidoreductase subunit C
MRKIETLKQVVENLLADKIKSCVLDRGELTIIVNSDEAIDILQMLRDNKDTSFEQCVDLCGVDYLDYHNDYEGPRFAVVYHLLSIKHNWRLRVRAFLPNDDFPMMGSAVRLYNVLDWFEREAFDLYGIVFENHPDLRRLLTDYGFIGHPFRKDFPLSGYMEMKYDERQKRVIYQAVTIEPREITPRVIREENYSGRN